MQEQPQLGGIWPWIWDEEEVGQWRWVARQKDRSFIPTVHGANTDSFCYQPNSDLLINWVVVNGDHLQLMVSTESPSSSPVFLTWDAPALRGYWITSGDICGRHNGDALT